MNRRNQLVSVLMISTMLSGCSSSVDDGVVRFVAEVKKTNAGYAEKVPDIVPAKPIKFDTTAQRDPFEKLILSKPETEQIIHAKTGPNPERPREALEGFPLESLSMVGTLEREGKFFALIKDKTGTVHLASVGNYVGENSGKIEMINEKEVDLTELMPDGKGGWRDHKAKMLLLIEPDKATTEGKGAPAADRGTPARSPSAPTKTKAAPVRNTDTTTKYRETTTRNRGTSSRDRGTTPSGQGRGG